MDQNCEKKISSVAVCDGFDFHREQKSTLPVQLSTALTRRMKNDTNSSDVYKKFFLLKSYDYNQIQANVVVQRNKCQIC